MKMIVRRVMPCAIAVGFLVQPACHQQLPGFDAHAQLCSRLPMTQDKSQELQAIVFDAVQLVNEVLNADVPFKLAVTWRPAQPAAIAVFLASATGLSGVAEVPGGCRCIVVNPDRLRRFRDFGNLRRYEFNVKLSEVLGLLLLHEAGHIYYRDTQGGPPSRIREVEGVALPEKFQLNREVRADLFAASQIRTVPQNKRGPDQFVAALNLQLTLSNAVTNQVLRRSIDYFGSTFLRPEVVFADNDEVHPGLELRLKIMQHAASPLPSSARSLAQAIDDWKRGKQREEQTEYRLGDTPPDKSRIYHLIEEGKLNLLYISPELRQQQKPPDGGSESSDRRPGG